MMSFVNNRISLRIVTPSSNAVKGHYLKVMNLLIMYSVFSTSTIGTIVLLYCLLYCCSTGVLLYTVVLVVVFHYCTIRFTATHAII